MPRRFKKRTFRRRKPRPGKPRQVTPWYMRKSTWDMAKMAASGVWYLKGLVNSEVFKKDSSINLNCTSAGSVTHISDIAQGDGRAARTGQSIFVRNVHMNAILNRTTSGDAVQQVRISLICDTQQLSDVFPTYADIYSQTTPYSHLNPDTVGRYQVLWSKVFSLDTVKTLSNNISMTVPLRHHVRYNGSNSGDIQKGGLYLCVVSTQATANYPQLLGELRVSYHDN